MSRSASEIHCPVVKASSYQNSKQNIHLIKNHNKTKSLSCLISRLLVYCPAFRHVLFYLYIIFCRVLFYLYIATDRVLFTCPAARGGGQVHHSTRPGHRRRGRGQCPPPTSLHFPQALQKRPSPQLGRSAPHSVHAVAGVSQRDHVTLQRSKPLAGSKGIHGASRHWETSKRYRPASDAWPSRAVQELVPPVSELPRNAHQTWGWRWG